MDSDIIERCEYFHQREYFRFRLSIIIALLRKYKEELSRVGENVTEGRTFRYQVSISWYTPPREDIDSDKTEKT